MQTFSTDLLGNFRWIRREQKACAAILTLITKLPLFNIYFHGCTRRFDNGQRAEATSQTIEKVSIEFIPQAA